VEHLDLDHWAFSCSLVAVAGSLVSGSPVGVAPIVRM
jgi:hypothetical protein